MERKEQYNYKSRIQEVVPTTRFGQGLFRLKKNILIYSLMISSLALASLFYLKRHKKRDDYGRAPVVSRLRAQSTLHITSSPSCNTMPFEILTPMKTSTTPSPPPIRLSALK
jgi:hypothetical protein